MKTLIITGASKGIGKAIAKEFHKHNYQVISLSRTKGNDLDGIEQVTCDLSNLETLESVFTSVLEKVKATSPTSITLFNNAGSLGLINQLENIDYQNIINSVTINYTAPFLLNSIFIKQTESWGIERKIRTISSGAANSNIDGWSVYCSTKAAIDRMTSVIGVEQENKPNPVHTIAIYPGVVDTGMQAEIRKATKDEFSNVERFKSLKENGDLSSPQDVALKIYAMQDDNQIANGSIMDVREYDS